MSARCIVFESFDGISKRFVQRYIKIGVPVFVVEPFVAFHKLRGKITGFPNEFPDYVNRLIDENMIRLLPAASLDPKTIIWEALDKAVGAVESVYPYYKKRYERLIGCVCDTLKSDEAENVFKKDLCNRLGVFYSVNILLYRIEMFLGPRQILVYPDTNVLSYFYLKALIIRSNQDCYEHKGIRFLKRAHLYSFIEKAKESCSIYLKLFAQTFMSCLLSLKRDVSGVSQKKVTYGVSIIGPRQLKDTNRGPDFIIENKKIRPQDVVYFPLFTLSKVQKKRLEQIPGNVVYLPKPGQIFSHFKNWKNLLLISIRNGFLANALEVNNACSALFEYFRWMKVLEKVSLKHFITHCDFGLGCIGRNIFLNQSGVSTWYFMDTTNFGLNFREEKGCEMRHPYWSYLCYDHFVAWSTFHAEYFQSHPGSFQKEVHLVGCLWNGHLENKDHARKQTKPPAFKDLDNNFLVIAFDTTYSRNGFASYADGIAFAKHIMQLVEECTDIYVILKEKKARGIHDTLDPILGAELIELYDHMNLHHRITICSNQADSSELISAADMVVSFPFTGTTFEALSINKPAIWHNPANSCKNTPYGKIEGVMTYNYVELKAEVIKAKETEPGYYKNPIPINSPLIDPYRDRKAIERFRELLTS